MRHSRAAALLVLALLLLALLSWWLLRGECPPAPVRPPEATAPPPTAPGPAPEPPPPDPVPAGDPEAVATVRVLDAVQGDPAREALLEAEAVASPPGPALSVEEAGAGAWTLRGPRGAIVRVVATAPGAVPAERWLTLGRRPEVPVHLAPVAPVFLRVIAADGGKPVAGASVVVSGEPVLFRGGNVDRTWRGRTDSDGLARCPEGGPGRRIRVGVVAAGFGFLSTEVEVPPTELVLPLEAPDVRGIRVGDERNSPLPGAAVLPAGLDGAPLLPREFAVDTDAEGRALLPMPRRSSPARTAVLVEAPLRPSRLVLGRPVVTTADDTVALERPWPGGITVLDPKGEILPGNPVRLVPLASRGVPLTGLEGDFEADTDARGRVTLPAPMPGATYVAAVGGAGEMVLATGTFAAEELRSFPEVRLPASTALSLRVTEAAGDPLFGAEILLLPPGSWDDPPGAAGRVLARAPSVRTDALGSADIRVASVSSSVLASAGPFAWRVSPWDGTAPEVRLAIPTAPLLSVRVADTNGGPIAGARVRVRPSRSASLPPSLRERAVQEAVTGPAGTAVFEVPAGCPLDVRADSRGTLDAAEVQAPPVGPGGGDLPLVLLEARTAWIVVEESGKGRLRDACVEVSYESLGARWLGRGSTGDQGVLAVPVPAPGARTRGEHAVFTLLGAHRRWGTLPLDALVDGARVVLSADDPDVFLLCIEETSLWPRGTPVRWWLRPAVPGRDDPGGVARVGEECALFVGREWRDEIIVQLPDSLPVVLPDERTSAKAKEAFYGDDPRRNEAVRRKPGKANDSAGLKRKPWGPWGAWTFLPLKTVELLNTGDGWARAKVSTRADGAPGWTSRPLAPGQRARCLVPTEDDAVVRWEPVRPAR